MLVLIFFRGIGDSALIPAPWGSIPIPNPQSPIPNPQSPINIKTKFNIILIKKLIKKLKKILYLWMKIPCLNQKFHQKKS